MRDIVFGLIAVLVGLTFCFRGYLTMRLVIPVWGAFSGFAIGAGLVSAISGDGFLANALGWVVGAVFAVVVGSLAYLYFEVSMVMGLTTIGFILGCSLMVALGVTWTWVVVLVGMAAGAAGAALAIVGDLPMVVLTVLTAFAGATATVGGLMLLLGDLHTADLDQASVIERVHDSTGLWVLYAVLALAGIVAQFRELDSITRSVRSEWESQRGRSA